MKKICVVTGTRAEYGLLNPVMKAIEQSSLLKLQLIATGMHLSPEFGLTYKDIEADGFKIDEKIEMLLSGDTPTAITKATGLGMIGFADALNRLKPDWLLVLGDRFELLAAVTASYFARIPVIHLHGGESTEGAIDEGIRHSISKMSYIHFVANEQYANRVIQLGENPSRVFTVGGLGVDVIKNTTLLNKRDLEELLGLKFLRKNFLITFHPVTLEDSTSENQLINLINCLDKIKDTLFIFTLPNADTSGRQLIKLIKDFSLKNQNVKVYISLGQLKYLSLVNQVDAVIGNSSSGLLEVPSFKKPTINIGDRQMGRLKAESIIDCSPNEKDIANAITKSVSKEFIAKLNTTINPYGEGGATARIINILENFESPISHKKTFFDLPLKS